MLDTTKNSELSNEILTILKGLSHSEVLQVLSNTRRESEKRSKLCF
ncbi:hypothetical protein [Lutibacter sp. HS1-25]|nr:hypothetical protein [Lutibacter sp. HS1-25]